ncbi:hypothetical protein [Clostridium uliginosum]|uniref:CoV 3a-like viroporin TM domain-containing protein n=1 Tax=Clostridium uliginosum TaxID=119641 RepID=A0A1I1H1W0_9CLOT|nr:hypothetical protein [Clostridium uliginosum]SFC15413.1 hypothetical protein SAMN05421842_10170 [Clostridium uliginosum]
MNINIFWTSIAIIVFLYNLIKSKRFRKLIFNFVIQTIIVAIKTFIPLALLRFLTKPDTYMQYRYIYIIGMVLSAIIVLRFVLRIIYNKNFNSYTDLLYSFGAICIFLGNLSVNIQSDKLIQYLFEFNTSSYVIQIFLFHIYLLINMFIIICGIITFTMLTIKSIIPIIEKVVGDDIETIKFVIRKLVSWIIISNKKIEKIFKIDIIEFFNNCINPFKEISIKPLYKNIPKLKLIFLFAYLITGILVIHYWNDLIYYTKFNITIPKEKMDSFTDYRLIFIIPLIGIFVNNVFKKEDVKIEKSKINNDKEENFEIESSIFD